jgi:hypothetical protein
VVLSVVIWVVFDIAVVSGEVVRIGHNDI